MKPSMRRWGKLVVVALMISMLLTSCSLLPANVANVAENALSISDSVTITREEYESLKKYEELDEILEIIDTYYYQEPDRDVLIEYAKRGILAGLKDQYSFYYNPQEYAQLWEDDEGDYAGIGIQIAGSYLTQLCTVTRVFTNSPAAEAGLHRGDVLRRVEDIDVTAATLNDAVDVMRGEVGKSVHLQVERAGELLEFDIVRAQIKTNWVNSMMLDDTVGYIALYDFSGDCSLQFQTQLDALVKQGAQGLILDLRDNPGGWVDDAVKIADIFLPKGTVSYLEYRSGEREYYAAVDDAQLKLPMVVLINEFSASASELLAGALKDYGVATLVGVNSFGKGVVQYVMPVGKDGAGLQLTVAQYFTPKGTSVHHVGIQPDIESTLPEGDNGMYEMGDLNDVQLKTAYDTLQDLMKK